MNDNQPLSVESVSQQLGLAKADFSSTIRNIAQLIIPVLFVMTIVMLVLAIVRIRQSVKQQNKPREMKWRWWLVVFVALLPLLGLAWIMVVFRALINVNTTSY